MASTIDSPHINIERGAKPDAEVIFLPTDEAGTPGVLNKSILRQLGFSESLIPEFAVLSLGYVVVDVGSQLICFVVTVGSGHSDDLLRRNLANALADKAVSAANSLWIPLMGTGAGNLPHDISLDITLNALQNAGYQDRSDVQVTISLPPVEVFESADQSSEATPSEVPSDHPVPERSDKQLAYGPALEDAFRCAAALIPGVRTPDHIISSTLLFFALCESQTPGGSRVLSEDLSASLLSGAVHALAGDRYREAWDAYFRSGFVSPQTQLRTSERIFSNNVNRVVAHANLLAREKNAAVIGVDDVIVALLEAEKGRHLARISSMGFSPAELLEEYKEARLGQIGKKLLNDVAATEDRLGYEKYAEAIRDFLIDASTPPPLSISVQAPWGAGKSSLMQQIRDKLDPREDREKHKGGLSAKESRLKLRDVLSFLDQKRKDESSGSVVEGRRWTVWFNAWKYDTSEQVWAGLVDAIVTQISDRLSPLDRELFLLRLQLARIDDGVIRKKIYDRLISIWLDKARTWCVAGLTTVSSLFAVHKVVQHGNYDAKFAELFAWSPGIAALVFIVGAAASYLKTREQVKSEPASFSLAQYLQVPDYNESLGKVHHVHRDLLRVLSVAPSASNGGVPLPIVIFIDDLDRCSPSSVSHVVEGISMFLASEEYRCMFVVGMDPQIIAAALEDAHAKVREQLPRYERTVPLGWRFMDKFVQLPFTIPPSKRKTLGGYVDWLTGTRPRIVPLPDVVPSRAPVLNTVGTLSDRVPDEPIQGDIDVPADQVVTVADAVREFKESRDVGVIIYEAVSYLSGNPREIKRLANLARLYLGLRDAARQEDASWASPGLRQYARWIVLNIKWPDMMRWLQWGADEGTWENAEASMELTARRLQFLQDQAFAARSSKDWSDVLADRLHVPNARPSDWASDPKLFEFFQRESRLVEHERLSAAAHRGFW